MLCFRQQTRKGVQMDTKELKTRAEIEAEGNRVATGEHQYELKAAFGDEEDFVVDIFTRQRIYFNYK